MIDVLLISFAFGAGVAAFFSPCAVALLPGYVTYYLSEKTSARTLRAQIFQGLWFSLQAVIGFFLIFGTAGMLVISVGQFIKSYFPFINFITAVFLIVLGITMLSKQDLLLRLPQIKNQSSSGVVFGAAYAVAALGCTFPLFVTVILQGISAPSFLAGTTVVLSYILGMSILMIGVTLATAVSKTVVQKYIKKVIPHIQTISALIIIVAGLYMIYVQLGAWGIIL